MLGCIRGTVELSLFWCLTHIWSRNPGFFCIYLAFYAFNLHEY